MPALKHQPADRLRVPGAPTRSASTGANWSTRSALTGPTWVAGVLNLQRTAGNRAASQAVPSTATPGPPLVQRQRLISVGPVRLNLRRLTVPAAAAVTLQAAVPRGQTVTWSLLADSAAVDSGTTIDANGLVTLGAGQAGGQIVVQATDSAGSGATASIGVILIKAPGSIASTAETGAAGGASYGANFRHTFAAVGGASGSECEGGRVNEIFSGVPNPGATSHTIPVTPFGPFTLSSNNPAALAAGWGIDSGGQMTGDDHVTMSRRGVDLRPLVANTSNPAPAHSLPAEFTVDQSLRSLEIPGNTWRTPFVSVPHVRGLRESGGTAEVFVSANGVEHVDPYVGRPAAQNITAAPASVEASAPRPPAPRGRGTRPPAPTPNTVQVSAETLPDGARLRFSIQGPALGCRINATTGELTVGTTPGTIRVRAQTDAASFDEVVVTVTARPAPVTPVPAAAGAATP